tara:strand:+ start:389 stop:565 length:177 start_codon:yes stop_codon:yes gene_type:complete
MPYENYKEYQEMMRDEAEQAAREAAAEPQKTFAHRPVTGGNEVWNPDAGWVFQSDYTP